MLGGGGVFIFVINLFVCTTFSKNRTQDIKRFQRFGNIFRTGIILHRDRRYRVGGVVRISLPAG